MAPKYLVFRLFTLFTLLLAANSSAFAQSQTNDKLTEIERETCLSFPMMTPVAQMKEGIHYENETYCDDKDSDGSCNSWSDYIKVKYLYLTVTTVDYYTADGKLVTTKVNKTKTGETGIGDTLEQGNTDLKKNIDKIIFESSDPVCKDSYYK